LSDIHPVKKINFVASLSIDNVRYGVLLLTLFSGENDQERYDPADESA